ncbi:MAG: glycosyltransferase 87 family protein [Solirubrobacteraceae bacterium]
MAPHRSPRCGLGLDSAALAVLVGARRYAADFRGGAGALYLLGVRSGTLMLLIICSYAFALSLGDGQADGLLALGVAVAWRYRDSWGSPVAIGLLVASKLFAWPLVLWLLLTRRPKSISQPRWRFCGASFLWARVGRASTSEDSRNIRSCWPLTCALGVHPPIRSWQR